MILILSLNGANLPFEILVSLTVVFPRRPCIWSQRLARSSVLAPCASASSRFHVGKCNCPSLSDIV